MHISETNQIKMRNLKYQFKDTKSTSDTTKQPNDDRSKKHSLK